MDLVCARPGFLKGTMQESFDTTQIDVVIVAQLITFLTEFKKTLSVFLFIFSKG